MDCENPDSEKEKTKLEINIRGFLRTYFKEDDKKLKDLEKDRSSYLTKHFFDPDGAVKRQKEYENDLEIIKYHLIAYKTELESINNSRRNAVLPTQPKHITKKTSANPPVVKKQTSKEKSLDNRNVFIVHGQNEETKNNVEEFLKSLNLEPIILHKQADLGKTIIEKVEYYSDVSFAVILLTKEDVGTKYIQYFPVAKNPTKKAINAANIRTNNATLRNIRWRARQNVIFEFGYFIAKLGRNRVAALCEERIERPSDIDGLLYTPLDQRGEWKKKLAKEIDAAGIHIDEKYL